MPASANLSYCNTILRSVSRAPQDISSLILDPGFTSPASSDFSPSDSLHSVHGPRELPLKNSGHCEKQARLISHPSLLLQLYLLTPKSIYLVSHGGEGEQYISSPTHRGTRHHFPRTVAITHIRISLTLGIPGSQFSEQKGPGDGKSVRCEQAWSAGKARTQGLWLEGKEGVSGPPRDRGARLQSHKCQANPWVTGNPDQHRDDF